MHKLFRRNQSGFTIVELIIVVAVIAIIAAITTVSYSSVQRSAREKSILSDIETVEAEVARYGVRNNGQYGSAIAWYSGAASNPNINFEPSSGNVIDIVTTSNDYCIRGFNPKAVNNSIANALSTGSSDVACDTILASTAAGGTGGGIVGWWKLNGNAVDDSDGNRDGVVYGATPTTDKRGVASGAYKFNGSTNYISLGTGADYNYTNFSVSVWAKAVGVPAHVRNLIGKGNWNTTNLWYIGFKSAADVSFTYGSASWASGPSYPLTSYDESQWVHYVGTVSPTQHKLYVNGALVATTNTSHVSVVNTNDLQIGGASYVANYFAGDIDDVRLFNRDLPASVVTSTYNAGPR